MYILLCTFFIARLRLWHFPTQTQHLISHFDSLFDYFNLYTLNQHNSHNITSAFFASRRFCISPASPRHRHLLLRWFLSVQFAIIGEASRKVRGEKGKYKGIFPTTCLEYASMYMYRCAAHLIVCANSLVWFGSF